MTRSLHSVPQRILSAIAPRRFLTLLPVAILITAPALAQFPGLQLPQGSQSASVKQTIGLTDLTVTYHRPAVNKRKVWGGLVPYGEVWRAGANENTTFATTDDVSINGEKLAAGKYGVHMIPAAGEWTVIFSRDSASWGSFAYDEKADALRIKVTPKPSEFQERLGYTFDDPTEDSTTLSMRWEALRVPFTVKVDVPTVVLSKIRTQLKGLPQYPLVWSQAAAYSLGAGGNLDEALQWVDRSISRTRNFQNLRTKAAILEKRGDSAAATALRNEAMTVATEADMNAHGYGLMGQNKTSEALAVFKKNVQNHPKSWNAHDSLAEAYALSGDKASAIQSYSRALELTTDPTQKTRIEKEIARVKSGV